MYSSKGHTFTDLEAVRGKVRTVGNRWHQIIAPAIIRLAEESIIGGPESDDVNGMFSYNYACMCNYNKSIYM